MNMRQKIAKKIILAGDPHAFDEGTLLAEVEQHEQRLANDPDVQRRKAESREASNRENFPLFVLGVLFSALFWGAITWFLPGLVKPGFAALAFTLMSFFMWKLVRI